MGPSFSKHEDFFGQLLQRRKEQHLLRMLRPHQNDFIDFSSNDYLGLARSQALKEQIAKEYENAAARHVPVNGSGGSRLLSGDSVYVEDLEEKIAGNFGYAASLFFSSGYTANLGLFSCIAERTDTIVFDEWAHASIRDGIRLSGARSWSFQHNDLLHLESLLRKADGKVFVAVESIYSMDGDQAPLKEIVSLCKQYHAALIVDEAHAAGIFGENGRGLVAAENLNEEVFACIFTFGKAFGVHGAAVAGSIALRQYLINFSRPFIYSTAPSLHHCVAVNCALDAVWSGNDLRQKLKEHIRYFQMRAAQTERFHFLRSDSAIQGIIIPGNEHCRHAEQVLMSDKLDVRAVLAPTVKAGAERLRINLHAFNTTQDIDLLFHALNSASINY
ncbi:MAG: pyridoxal phosphate-dependent aminotransferase family protein [Bacteroidia bacterium]